MGEPAAGPAGPGGLPRVFHASALLLFLELACIRWFAAEVVFLTFFTNLLLIACVVGMSAGCLAAARRFPWLETTPALLLLAALAARVFRAYYFANPGFAVRVGDPSAPEMIYFGTEYRVPSFDRSIPVEAVAAACFLLVALVFVGPGQALGRSLAAAGNPRRAYDANLLGSLAGIAGFSAMSLAALPPLAWFGAGFLGLLPLLAPGRRRLLQGALLAAALAPLSFEPVPEGAEIRWSPYYRVYYDRGQGSLSVNGISHQFMQRPEQSLFYALPYLLRRDAGMPPIGEVLIVGAGTGNDVAHALRQGVRRVEAVEIDPVILSLGADHPAVPYADPRVRVRLDDGRAVLSRGGARYDAVLYGLVDSLALQSAYANVRLESFLFTREAFAAARERLKPGGTFVVYNFVRKGWVVRRIAKTMEEVFGRPPVVLAIPPIPEVADEEAGGGGLLAMLIAGETGPIEEGFRRGGGVYRLPLDRPPGPEGPDGFAPGGGAGAGRVAPVSPSRLAGPPIEPASDDWPFLYLRDRRIPRHNRVGIALLAALSIGIVLALHPARREGVGARFFLLGAAFMLLETRAVVEAALLFGSTWLVNSIVIAGILLVAAAGNRLAPRLLARGEPPLYAAIGAGLVLSALLDPGLFLPLGAAGRAAFGVLALLLPVGFGSAAFAGAFAKSRSPARDFGSNVAGVALGGLLEYGALVGGYRSLLLLAGLLYLGAFLFRPRSA